MQALVLPGRRSDGPREVGTAYLSCSLRWSSSRTVSKPIGATLDRRGSRSRSQTLSEQRRALLLPQEVKELGTEKAIVFYEGLRPIRCRKIRYFAERRFVKRLLPPPAVPLPLGSRCTVNPPPAHDLHSAFYICAANPARAR
jgi:type IV secretion system protein VirD4